LYISFQEILREEREEGRKDGRKEGRLEERKAMILETLAEKDITTESIQKKLNDINDMDQLKSLTIAAISARNLEDFKISLEAIQE